MANRSAVQLTEAEVTSAMEYFKEKYPKIHEMADFEMENARECIMWIRFMWSDSHCHSLCLGMMAALLTLFRMHLVSGVDLQTLDGLAYMDYNKNTPIEAMQAKIDRKKMPVEQVTRKIAEIQSALSFWIAQVGQPPFSKVSMPCCATAWTI